ncbi:SLBB domain-containing protein [Haloferula rosea]|uniref:SLBB domain-containing protein n=1 Tax=Haloferula rosea TaxID=490093 RepID=A0A934RCL5_9BACT|nr:SLBB domain-containing protein [Haloferula rosea]
MAAGMGLTVAAAALVVFSDRDMEASNGVTTVASSEAPRPERPGRSADFEIVPGPGFNGRRALGSVSLATRGQPSLASVTVVGFVRRPGRVSLGEVTTIRGAIEFAGGATEFGSLKRVKLVRDGRAHQFDLTAKEADLVMIGTNDIIEVPQKMLLGR